MFKRVREFGKAHPELFPGSSPSGKTFATLAQAIAEIEANSVAKPLPATDGRQAKAAARAEIKRALTIVARTARDLARKTPGSANPMAMPDGRSDVDLVEAARKFVIAGEARKDELMQLGLAPERLTELGAAADALALAINTRMAGRQRAAGAQRGLDAAMATAFDAIRTLDVMVANIAETDPVVFGEWTQSRRVAAWRRSRAAPEEVTEATAEPATTTGTEVATEVRKAS